MIVVAGGTGLLGRSVVNDLRAQGQPVRVLTRRPAGAAALFGSDVEVVAGDVRSRDQLDTLLAGARVVVSAVHGFLGPRGAGPRHVDDLGNRNLVDAASGAGAAVVLVSVLGAAADSPLELFRAKHRAEQHLRSSSTPWTIVRPAAFIETWLAILTKTANTSGRPLIFGRGEQPIPFVSVLDVAAVVARATTDASLAGQVLELAGSPYTMTELAQALQKAHGWQGDPRHLPRTLLSTLALLARPFSPALARQSRTAVAMDTAPPTLEVPPAPPPGSTGQSLSEVVSRFVGA